MIKINQYTKIRRFYAVIGFVVFWFSVGVMIIEASHFVK